MPRSIHHKFGGTSHHQRSALDPTGLRDTATETLTIGGGGGGANTRWGVSGSDNSPTDYWTRQALTTGRGLHAQAMYAYNSSAVTQPTWNTWQLNNVPNDHDIWFQTKGTTRASYDQTLATFPANRVGKVYMHHWNEPEDNMTGAVYQARCADLFAAIDAANRPYIVKSCEFMEYSLNPVSGRTLSQWVPTGVECIGFSIYAGWKIVNGHQIAQQQPSVQQGRVTAWMSANHPTLPWSGAAGGFGLMSDLAQTGGIDIVHDPTSQANQLAWAQATAIWLTNAGALHWMWFDEDFSNGLDYRIDGANVDLFNYWQSATIAAGQ